MIHGNQKWGKVSYGFLFLIAVPLVLVRWTVQLDTYVLLPSLRLPALGLIVAVAGGIIMVWGMVALMIYGRGLPMNPFPPQLYVGRSIYKYFSHPIYLGFCLTALGTSIFFGSGNGLFIANPLLVAGCAALVLGYENLDLERRFPDVDKKKLIGLPRESMDRPTVFDRASIILLVLIPWFTMNNLFFLLYLPSAPSASPAPTDSWWTSAGAIAGLFFILCGPLAARSKLALRRFCISGWVGTTVLFLAGIIWPEAGIAHSMREESFLGEPSIGWWPLTRLLSIQVAFIGLSLRIYFDSKRLRVAAIILAGVGVCSSILLSKNPVLHLGTAVFVYVLSDSYHVLWTILRGFAERVANSWKEWTWGPVRIINHGLYVGGGTLLGVLLCGILVGSENMAAVVVFGLIAIIVSALWAQLIEGSERLKRPFGFYGGMVGIIFGSIAISFVGSDVWLVLAGISIVMPWIQAVGRLRCLVNGCCHGGEAKPAIGIRYLHNRSRVCSVAGLKGVSLHPTPLYSILWLVPVGALLMKGWFIGAPQSLLFGLYLIFTGLGRFVEEAYRGEPQTPIKGNLRLYQWAAIISVLAGVAVSWYPTANPEILPFIINWKIAVGASVLGLAVFFAMGVDFPKSNARFSRLV